MRVAFVYPNPRRELAVAVAAGEAPDTTLLGENHLAEHGIDAIVHDSFVRRRSSGPTRVDRLRWHTRELTLPWELEQADVVVTPLHKLLPLASRLRRRQRVVVLFYGIPEGSIARMPRLQREVLRGSLRSAATVVAISEACRRQLLETFGVPAERVVVRRLGVDERWWSPQPPGDQPVVLTVGRDLARDYETFTRALEGTDLRGVIAAKPENVRDVRPASNVEVQIDVPLTGVRELVRSAACVVVPMVAEQDPRGSEGSGTTAILEAMASARATVSTDRAHLEEYLERDVTTVVVPPKDPAALREAILAVVGDRERAASLGTAGRALVERELTTAHLAAGLVPVIRRVAA